MKVKQNMGGGQSYPFACMWKKSMTMPTFALPALINNVFACQMVLSFGHAQLTKHYIWNRKSRRLVV